MTSLRVCWSEPLLVAHATLLDISCQGSYYALCTALFALTCIEGYTVDYDLANFMYKQINKMTAMLKEDVV